MRKGHFRRLKDAGRCHAKRLIELPRRCQNPLSFGSDPWFFANWCGWLSAQYLFPLSLIFSKSIYVEEAKKKTYTRRVQANNERARPNDWPRYQGCFHDSGCRIRYSISTIKSLLLRQCFLIDMWSSDPFFQDPKLRTSPLVLPIWKDVADTFHRLGSKVNWAKYYRQNSSNKLVDSGNVRTVSGNIERVELLSSLLFTNF